MLSRRGFLATLAAVPAATWLPASAPAIVPPVAAPPLGVLTFRGVPIVMDADCPRGVTYLLNPNTFYAPLPKDWARG